MKFGAVPTVSQVNISGSTSGTTALVASALAGSSVLTIPNVTDTLANRMYVQSLLDSFPGSANVVSVGLISRGTWAGAIILPQFLTPMGASGPTTHSPGIVPDPGATAGTARFLCEDGMWRVPAGGGGVNTGIDGGTPSSNYGGTTGIDGGTPSSNYTGTIPIDGGVP